MVVPPPSRFVCNDSLDPGHKEVRRTTVVRRTLETHLERLEGDVQQWLLDVVGIVAPLAATAKQTLESIGYPNIHLRTGDGYKGWPEAAPFDAIIVTCAPEEVPQALVEQLKEGGRMIIPVGKQWGAQSLYLLKKQDGTIRKDEVLPVRFVPMTRASEACD